MKKIIPILSVFALSAQAVLFAADMQIKGKNLERLEAATPKTAAAKPQKQRNILVFSRTCGFRHEQGIPAAKLAFSLMGEKLGVWNAKISEDLADISPDKLSQYDCIVLNNTTGMCFGEPQPKMRKLSQAERAEVQKRSDEICKALVEYVRNGGGILAIHAAVDSYNYDPFRNREYTDMLGIKIPALTIPVKPGRNLAVIVEVAAMNNRQKKMGYNAAKELLQKLGMPVENDDPDEEEINDWDF